MLVLLSSALLAQSTLGTLLWLAVVFFILSIVAFLFGANGVAGMSAGIRVAEPGEEQGEERRRKRAPPTRRRLLR